MDEPTKRAWSEPELTVLVRRAPEEAVLGVCKVYGDNRNPLTGYGFCKGNAQPCTDCSTQSSS